MIPPSEHVHWLFATGVLFVGLCLLAEAVVGREVWCRRRWRAYLWPGGMFLLGLLMWPVMVFYTNSAIHMLAHGSWAQVMMFTGGTHLGLAHGKLRSRWWELTMPVALAVSGSAFLIHEQNGWLFQRSAFLHHALGWWLLGCSVFAIGRALKPRMVVWQTGFAVTFVLVAAMLYCDRDLAPIFGHLSNVAGAPHR